MFRRRLFLWMLPLYREQTIGESSRIRSVIPKVAIMLKPILSYWAPTVRRCCVAIAVSFVLLDVGSAPVKAGQSTEQAPAAVPDPPSPDLTKPAPNVNDADVADIPSLDLRAEGDPDKRYFLIGPKTHLAKTPAEGYRLLLVLPGGDGGADFHPFVKRIAKFGLGDTYLVAQLVAPKTEESKNVVWPTSLVRVRGMKFTTESFIEAVVRDVRQKHKIDTRHLFALGWSSAGPPVYALSLQPAKSVTGSFVAMSVFKPDQLPPLEKAKGHAYFLLHSPQDFIPIRRAEQARDTLRQHGAKAELVVYEGGHGWHGDVFGTLRRGVAWLEANCAQAGPP